MEHNDKATRLSYHRKRNPTKWESLKFVLAILAIINGQYAYGYYTKADEDILSPEATVVLEKTVHELTAKYDTAIREIQTVVAQQEAHVDSLQNDNAVLKEAVIALKTEADHYDVRLNDLTRTVAEQGKAIVDLEISNKEKAISIEILENKLSTISPCQYNKKDDSPNESNAKPVKPNVDKVQTRNTHTGHVRRAVENEVAFYAYVSHNGLQSNLGVNQDLVFDHNVTNIGNGYIPHHGTFVAPVAGTYVFSATLHTVQGSRANFVVNGNVVARFYGDGDEPTQVSQTIVVSIPKGADVSIQNIASGDSYYGEIYTTFTGFLLYESYANPSVIG